MRAGLCRVMLALLLGIVAGRGAAVLAQSGAAGGQTVARKPCGPDATAPSEADRALLGRKYADAERLYGAELAADPTSGAAMAGLVRTALGEGKLPEALAMAMKFDGAHANDAAVLDALGEVRFRRGEVDEAAMAFNRSLRADPCSGLTHFDIGRYLNFAGMYGSGQRQLEFAHTLAPQNQEIERRWKATHAVPLTGEQLLAVLKRQLEMPAHTEEQKAGIEAAIKGIEAHERGSCELVTPAAEAKLPIIPIAAGLDPQATMYAASLEVQFNGKKKRLEIDTGASGMILSSSVAKAAGLVPEAAVTASGVGDDGMVKGFVTHVDDIKIGKMEFKNCMVQVLGPGSMLDRMPDMDGLIGPDVFKDYLVTLDVPSLEMRLAPLPARPDQQAVNTVSLATAEGGGSPVSIADSAKDRYVAPEMKDWTPVFRWQHMLILPTMIGKAPTKLFIMDLGASHSLISPAAAREVTQVSGFNAGQLEGISGQVQQVLVADKVSIGFANIVEKNGSSMMSIDTAALTRSVGVEMSGFIGFPLLRELVISIDYRDNLIHVVYDPKKGYHAHG